MMLDFSTNALRRAREWRAFCWFPCWGLLAAKQIRLELYSVGKKFGLAAKEFGQLSEEFCSARKKSGRLAEEFGRLGKELYSAEKESGRLPKEFGQAAEEFCRLRKELK
ncbi:hypothetical protein [Candidatus Electronema sp. PJ]|uniref:hypothetical protein n=1 Tax=Candidatus Electronema sp. PJ TaxID=3401572 RepID=UPI003AA8DBA9